MEEEKKLKREFKGIWIPKEIWFTQDINFQEKLLWAEIDSLDTEKGCIASNEYFANFFNLSKTQVSLYISDLKKKGYIQQEWFDGRQRILHSNLKLVKGRLTENLKPDLVKTLNIDNNIDNKKINIRDKSLQPDGCERGFDKNSLKELDKLVGSYKSREDLKIVFAYAQAIGKNFSNNKEKESFIKRNIRVARLLLGYPIQKVVLWCKILPYLELKKWTLETVGKFIDEDPIDIIMRYREKDYDTILKDLEEEGIVRLDNREGWKVNF